MVRHVACFKMSEPNKPQVVATVDLRSCAAEDPAFVHVPLEVELQQQGYAGWVSKRCIVRGAVAIFLDPADVMVRWQLVPRYT